MAKAKKTEQEAAPKTRSSKDEAVAPKAKAKVSAAKDAAPEAAPSKRTAAGRKAAAEAAKDSTPPKRSAARTPAAPKALKSVEPDADSAPAPRTRRASAGTTGSTVSKKTGSLTPGPVTPAQMLSLEEEEVDLPLEYGDTKVVLLTRDPEWIFVYWEINGETRRQHGLERGQHKKQLLLRLQEVRDGNAISLSDVPVNDYTSSWYVRVPAAGRKYRVQLGRLDETGSFTAITASNDLEIPRMGISEETDVQFAEINDEIYSQIVHLSGGLHVRERLGSDEFLRGLQQRVFESLGGGPLSSAGIGGSSGLLSGLFSGMLSSGALSSGALSSGLLSSGAFGLSSAFFSEIMTPGAGGEAALKRPKDKDKDFWLEVGVDVIVYGATEPDAKVKFMGQEIRLTPDGTFRVRMVLPDTTIEFPVEATSNDGKHKRGVKPVVKRHTEGDPRKPL